MLRCCDNATAQLFVVSISRFGFSWWIFRHHPWGIRKTDRTIVLESLVVSDLHNFSGGIFREKFDTAPSPSLPCKWCSYRSAWWSSFVKDFFVCHFTDVVQKDILVMLPGSTTKVLQEVMELNNHLNTCLTSNER